ncbi:hypothetical protein TUN199_04349 [Pyrenophora tritici-repentis]|uniref:Uncharacterized protein n=2 Tax=Pyrenophora tritici-repentis TaxID=45151 RepID=A0A922NER6_9PLEO|nr:uncharacterized protein PTRG_01696 [Pyrenophora tritici-repentis Pt-1C-BFP]KAI0586586.1 hypothetical protein Alg130_04190 [Pyrenophora tritici-repentis]EDU41134.1 predicted protein [Pyrenophora tritici-repentis Pt-1C-BFP]KAI0611674.1 hypothetical protein TUN205_04096 [Pyrenophora tritici-repentis]KAI0623670.1 hypothetical protein TUN199_04349 [Pyrenophora tritici-repentis]KAI1513862.1 hypothetical protein Ptr86124_007764 [Pyrenophora tritici-repentis]
MVPGSFYECIGGPLSAGGGVSRRPVVDITPARLGSKYPAQQLNYPWGFR